jgi:hypothetical protein
MREPYPIGTISCTASSRVAEAQAPACGFAPEVGRREFR